MNVEIDNFEIEDYNLINKLNNLNANDNDIKNNENNDVFEEKETFNEYDSKLPNNVIDNLYLILPFFLMNMILLIILKKMVKLNMYQNCLIMLLIICI